MTITLQSVTAEIEAAVMRERLERYYIAYISAGASSPQLALMWAKAAIADFDLLTGEQKP